MNNENNNQNNFNLNNSFNDDAFNVFNQNAENFQKQQEEKRALEEQKRLEQQHPKQVAVTPATQPIQEVQQPQNNKESKKIDLNDLSTLPVPKKKEKVEKTPAQEAADKKKMEIILLIVLVLVLGVVLFWAYNVFFVEKVKGVNETEQVLLNKNAIKHIEPKAYSCQKDYSQINNYNLPLTEKILNNSVTYNTNYLTENDFISNINEEIRVSYNAPNNEEEDIIRNYCYKYNKIENNYQLKCQYEYGSLYIYNNFDIINLNENEISQNNISIKLLANRETEINKLLELEKKNNSSCTQNVINNE